MRRFTMKSFFILITAALGIGTIHAAESAGPTIAQGQVKLLRHPSYFKGKIAFSYLGDIWVANENGSGAERLTDNTAREIYPRFSPDGLWIAFSSNRDGNYD